MKAFYRLLIVTLLLIGLIFAAANLILRQDGLRDGRQYRVDASRAAAVIETSGIDALDLSDYETLCGVSLIEEESDLLGGERDYLIREIGGALYRFDYQVPMGENRALPVVNILLGVMALLVLALLLYVQAKILRPFARMRDVPIALSKGNLAVPIQENRQRFFGRFVWGMNMLRDSMEAPVHLPRHQNPPVRHQALCKGSGKGAV